MSTLMRTNRMLLEVCVDLGLTLLSLFLASALRFVLPIGKEIDEPGAQLNIVIYLLTSVIWVGVFMQFNMYTKRWLHIKDEWCVLLIAMLTALLILAGSLYMSFRQVSRLQFVYFGFLDFIMLASFRVIRSWWGRKFTKHNLWRVLVIDSGPIGCSIAERFITRRDADLDVAGFLDDDPSKAGQVVNGIKVLGTLDEIVSVVQSEHISEIILALPFDAHDRILSLASTLEPLQVQVSLVPDVLDLAWFGTYVSELGGVPILRLRESPLCGPARIIKRLADIFLSIFVLVVVMPLMAVVALMIKVDSPGPIIIRQKRIGENARPFNMLKFRTMYADIDVNASFKNNKVKDGGMLSVSQADSISLPMPALHKRPDDPRVTHVGKLLRRYSVDELPQLINVLTGEMSLVGPRPELPWLVDRYEPWQRHRFAVPPGMTGWWQVHGRSDRPMHLNIEDDLYYIRNYSLWLDILILLRTIPSVLSGKGAY